MIKYIKKKYIQFFICKHNYEKIRTIPTFDKITQVVVKGKNVQLFTAFDKLRCKNCDRIKYSDYYQTDKIHYDEK